MSVTKPDATAFDSATDSIASARSELLTLVNSFNTIADDYNSGTLGGGGGLGANPAVLSTVTSLPDTRTQTARYSQVLVNTSNSGILTVVIDDMPIDNVWELTVICQGGMSGSVDVKFTHAGDSAGDSFTSGTTNIGTTSTHFTIRQFSTPEPNFNRMFAVDTVIIDSKVT